MQQCPFLSFDEQTAKRKLLKMFEAADSGKSGEECCGVTNRQRCTPTRPQPLRCPNDALDHPIAAG